MNKLRTLRKEKGLTQTEVAKYIGTSQNNYSYWENGKVKIDNATLLRLADFFNVSVDYLLGREDDLGNVKKQDVLSEEDKDILNQLHALGPFELEAIKIQIKALADAKKSDALTHGKK